MTSAMSIFLCSPNRPCVLSGSLISDQPHLNFDLYVNDFDLFRCTNEVKKFCYFLNELNNVSYNKTLNVFFFGMKLIERKSPSCGT